MFRFTIREMFLLVLIVALGVGWWVDHRRMSTELAGAMKWRNAAGTAEHMLSGLGWKVHWDFRQNWFNATKLDRSYNTTISVHEPSDPIHFNQ